MGYIKDLKEQALATLRGKWGSFVGLTFIYLLIVGIAFSVTQLGEIFTGSFFTKLALIMTSSGVVLTILSIPLQVGYYIAHLNSSRQDLPADIVDLFLGYKRFWHVLVTMLLMVLAVTVGFILFVVPGIILCFAYAMVPFVLYDNPELSAVEVLQKSRMMMQGHKWDLFVLYISFIGWAILGMITLFIGYYWLGPYIQMTEVKFYEQIRAEFEGEEEMPEQEEETLVEESTPVKEEKAPADVAE